MRPAAADYLVAREVAGLRERVEVLERILTDRCDSSSSLAREIEALRD